MRAWIAVAAVAFGLLFIVSIGFAVVLIFVLAEQAISLPPPDGLDAARTFLAAFVGAFGAPFLVWRTWVAHRQAKTAAEQARVALENRFTSVFSDAVKLLGEMRDVRKVTAEGTDKIETVPNTEARIGALYSLERLLRESEKDQSAILETICAYVRENSPADLGDDETIWSGFLRGEPVLRPTKRSDVQVALDVIGRRSAELRERGIRERWSLDLSDANLLGYHFEERAFDGVRFSNSFLIRLRAQGASFRSCVFKNSPLRWADLTGACFDNAVLEHSMLANSKLEDTSFKKARLLACELEDSNVISVDIRGANLDEEFPNWKGDSERIIEEGPLNFERAELGRLYNFIDKATHDQTTSVSEDVSRLIAYLSTPAAKAHYEALDRQIAERHAVLSKSILGPLALDQTQPKENEPRTP